MRGYQNKYFHKFCSGTLCAPE